MEYIRALRLKLHWMGVPFHGPGNVYFDMLTMVQASTQPEVTLAKKHNGNAHHVCCEALATGMIR
jgi:hypothetical protein